MVPGKPAKFENPGWNFSKMFFVIYSCKTGKYLNQDYFTGSSPGIVWMKYYLPNFDSTHLTCDLTVFPSKIIPNIAKSNRIFPRKGRGDKDFILTYLDSSMVEVFRSTAYFFILTIIRRKRGVKLGRKVLTLSPSLFHKYSNPSKKFQTVFLFARVLPLLRISAILDHIWRVRTQKTSQKGQFRGCWTVRKILDIFNLTTTNAILIKLTTIMYFHESLNWKALRVRNSFFGLI